MKNDGRTSEHLKNILSDLSRDKFLTPNLRASLVELDEKYKSGKFQIRSSSIVEEESKVKIILSDLPNAVTIAKNYVDINADDNLYQSGTEAHGRLRLYEEMKTCMKKGGVLLPDGQVERDVVQAVIKVIDEILPETVKELQAENRPSGELI